MSMNVKWAIAELEKFVQLGEQHTQTYNRSGRGHQNPEIKEMYDDVMVMVPVVEEILNRGFPKWRNHLPRMGSWGYDRLLRVARQAIDLLKRREELEKNLGEDGPSLSAETMHPDVWDAAKSLWRSGHFGEAVSAAAKSVNASLQAKVGRRDASDMKLVSESFNLDAPKPGVPRLRLMDNDGSDTYKSLHEGALAFGRGCFMGIRNVLAHEYGQLAEPPEEVALHYLAAFSVLARWIDQAKVEK